MHPSPSACSVGVLHRDLPAHVAERVAALVAVRARVGQRADAGAVEHEHDRAGERRRGHAGGAVRVSPARTGSSLPIAGS